MTEQYTISYSRGDRVSIATVVDQTTGKVAANFYAEDRERVEALAMKFTNAGKQTAAVLEDARQAHEDEKKNAIRAAEEALARRMNEQARVDRDEAVRVAVQEAVAEAKTQWAAQQEEAAAASAPRRKKN